MTATRLRGERGIVRGCCLLALLLLVVLGLGAFLADRAVAAPDLGAPPRGPSHGSTQTAIALALGAQLVAELVAQPHGVVTLSEQDLTVLAQEHNPHPGKLRDVVARIRDGLVDVSASTSIGPLGVTVVADFTIGLQPTDTTPQITATVVSVDVGALDLPSWLRDRIVGAPSVAVDPLFDSTPALRAVRANLECLVVAPDGLRIGVHRPGSAPDASVCGS